MKIIFLGTPVFVLPVLEELAKTHNVMAVFCQPDKLGNRNKLTVSPVKTFANEKNIEVFQPQKIDDFVIEKVKNLKPDVMVVSAYGKILPQKLIDIAPILNIHPSLLPKYRGSAPVQWALINGEKEIGITIMKLCFQMDVGDILLQEKIAVLKEDNAQTILEKTFKFGAQMLLQVLKDLPKYLIGGVKQNENEATVYPMLEKQNGKIDFKNDANQIVNLVKGVYVWPVAFCTLNGKNLKIFDCETTEYANLKNDFGEVVELSKKGICVKCNNSFLLIKNVQIENGKRMNAFDFINGKNIKVGDVLC